MSDKYILDENKSPIKADLDEWAAWYEKGDDQRRVGLTETRNGSVSTVFLGLDHSWGHGPPLLFETMVFSGTLDQEQVRYSTWQEAEAGHEAMVKRVTRGFPSHQSESGK